MNNNLKLILDERKNRKIDAFGLTYQTLNSDEIVNTETPYDSFIFEDSLRLIASLNSLDGLGTK